MRNAFSDELYMLAKKIKKFILLLQIFHQQEVWKNLEQYILIDLSMWV